MRLFARGGHKAFQPGHTRAHHALAVQLCASQLEHQGRFIVFERACHQPGLQGLHLQGWRLTKSHIGAPVPAMIALGPSMVGQGKNVWGNAELFGDKRYRALRRDLEVRWHQAQLPERAQLEGIPQTMAGFALAVDCACVALRE